MQACRSARLPLDPRLPPPIHPPPLFVRLQVYANTEDRGFMLITLTPGVHRTEFMTLSTTASMDVRGSALVLPMVAPMGKNVVL